MLPFPFRDSPRGLSCFIWRHTVQDEKIKVLALLPMELPKEIELDNTLEAMQKFVDGNIECLTFYDSGSEVILVCNDEGKLLGLPLNRPLWDGADVLAGISGRMRQRRESDFPAAECNGFLQREIQSFYH